MIWNAAAYAANSAVQLSWARELIARLKLRGDERVLDVGCGDGKVTAEIARALPDGAAVGADISAEMIGFAREIFPPTTQPNLEFHVMDARKISFTRLFDLVFSNAALHWVDDHAAVLRGFAAALKPGGRLAVCCGGIGNAHDVFLAMRPELRSPRWREFFRRMPTPYFFYPPGDYEQWLARAGFKINAVELAPKDTVYSGADGFADWLRDTWLPYVQRVPETKVGQASRRPGATGETPVMETTGETPVRQTGETPVPLKNLREEFIRAVTGRYVAQHPPDEAGNVHVRMVCLEIDAVKI